MEYYNQKTRIITSTMGILLGCAGFINHGLFEVLQGNNTTPGFFIEAISEADRYWIHGTEGAFSIMPTFMLTGISVMLVSLTLIIWCAKYIEKKHGVTIFLLLLVLLTAVGGGIGHIILFLPVWAYATRINKPLDWWQRSIPEKSARVLASLWKYFLAASVFCWLMVMELGIFGWFPGQNNPDSLLNIVFLFIFASVLLINATFICGFCADLRKRQFIFE